MLSIFATIFIINFTRVFSLHYKTISHDIIGCMANTKIYGNGYSLSLWFGLPNYASDPKKPTVSELNATVNITESVAWENWSFGAQASNQIVDPSILDVGNTQTRGFANFGGTISFFYPNNWTDTNDANVVTFTALEDENVLGYIIIRADGLKTTSSAPDANKAAVANDFVYIYKVISDGWSDVNTGEAGFKYTITFQPQGDLWANAIVATSVTTVTPAAIGATDYTVGGKTPLGTYRTGRQLAAVSNIVNGYPGWYNWSSEDTSIATVDGNGVVTGVAVGGPIDIIATDKVTGTASSALAVTIA